MWILPLHMHISKKSDYDDQCLNRGLTGKNFQFFQIVFDLLVLSLYVPVNNFSVRSPFDSIIYVQVNNSWQFLC